MSGLVARLRSIQASPRSSFQELARLLGQRNLERIHRECPDRRYFFARAAAELRRSENDLMRALAARLGLQFCEFVAPMPGIDAFGVALDELAAGGCIPQRFFGERCHVVCCDPALLTGIGARLGAGIRYAIASWSSIRGALEATRRMQRRQERDIQMAACAQCLIFMLEEAARHGRSALRVSFGDTRPYYEIDNGRGTLRGEIKPALIGTLERYFADVAARRAEAPAGVAVRLESGAGGPYTIVRGGTVRYKPGAEHGPAGGEVAWILDDDPVFTTVLGRFLTSERITHRIFQDGRELMRALRSAPCPPAALICDLHMPDLDGRAIAASLRDSGLSRSSTFIGTSSDDSADSEIEFLRSGADLFVSKRADPRLILAHLEKIIGNSGRRAVA